MTTLAPLRPTFPFLAASARRLGTLAAPSLGIAVKDVRIGDVSATPTTLILFAHATGFCKEVWDPVIIALDAQCKSVGVAAYARSLDFSGHGDSWQRGEGTDVSVWDTFAIGDVAEALEAAPVYPSVTRLCGVGHSFGGAALLASDIARVAHFDAMVLYEPIVFKNDTPPGGNFLSSMTAKRRFLFPDFDAVHANLVDKPVFKTWVPEAFDAYVNHGFMHTALRYSAVEAATFSGSPVDNRVCLKCDRRFESAMYRGVSENWRQMKAVRAACLVLCGEETTTFSEFGDPVDQFRAIAASIPVSEFMRLKGCTHFGVMEHPDTLARLVAVHLFPGPTPLTAKL